MRNRLRLGSKLLLLATLLVPTVAFAYDHFAPGNPCHAEGITYYSDASHTTVVGVDEFVCWSGHQVTGQSTPYYSYTYYGRCCSERACTSDGVCGVEP